MLTIVNISKGNLHIDSMGLMLAVGERFIVEMSKFEALVNHPELEMFVTRGRVLLEEAPEQDSKEELEHENA